MRVDAAEAEGVDGGSARDVSAVFLLPLNPQPSTFNSLHPRLRFRQHTERAVGSGHARGGLSVVGGRRQRAVPECEKDFHQASRAGSGEQMADVRLHSADDALLRPRVFVLPELMQRLDFDGVSDGSPRRVAFDQIDIARLPIGLFVGGTHRAELPFGSRGQQVRTPIVREADPRDDAINVIARRDCIAQPFEDEDARSLTDNKSIRFTTERRTTATLRQRLQLREAHLRVLAIGPRHPPRQHRIGAMSQQFLRRELQRVERRCTGRIEREGRPAQTKALCDEARRETGRVAI